MKHALRSSGGAFVCFLVVTFISASIAFGLADRRFDVATIVNSADGSDPHFSSNNLAHLNFTTTNGHILAMSTDANRATLNAAGNFLAVYYNNFQGMYQTYTATQAADAIQNYCVTNDSSTGGVPQWLVINEISTNAWPNDPNYRAFVIAVCNRLKNTYNHAIIFFSPFKNPTGNSADWTSLSNYAHIAIEGYLGGEAVNGSGNSVSWCQSQYQSYVDSYHARGVPYDMIYMAEHYGNTVYGTGYGRSGASYAGWDNAIKTRCTAIHNIFTAGHLGGYISYGWGGNGMGVSEADQCHFEDTYATKTLP